MNIGYCDINSSPPSAAYMRRWIGSAFVKGNGLSPVRPKATTWTNADLLSLGTYCPWIKIHFSFIHENVFEHVVCKMAAVLCRGWVKAWIINHMNRFYPRPVMAFGYCRCLRLSVCVCVCVCVSVNHQFVRTITCHPLKLQSPNLDQKCKRPWLRSLLFLGFIDLDLQGQIELKSQNLPHFGLESLSGQ